MRTCIFALAAIVPAFAIDRAGAADEPPAFSAQNHLASPFTRRAGALFWSESLVKAGMY